VRFGAQTIQIKTNGGFILFSAHASRRPQLRLDRNLLTYPAQTTTPQVPGINKRGSRSQAILVTGYSG
jgi:hypothetical protein